MPTSSVEEVLSRPQGRHALEFVAYDAPIVAGPTLHLFWAIDHKTLERELGRADGSRTTPTVDLADRNVRLRVKREADSDLHVLRKAGLIDSCVVSVPWPPRRFAPARCWWYLPDVNGRPEPIPLLSSSRQILPNPVAADFGPVAADFKVRANAPLELKPVTVYFSTSETRGRFENQGYGLLRYTRSYNRDQFRWRDEDCRAILAHVEDTKASKPIWLSDSSEIRDYYANNYALPRLCLADYQMQSYLRYPEMPDLQYSLPGKGEAPHAVGKPTGFQSIFGWAFHWAPPLAAEGFLQLHQTFTERTEGRRNPTTDFYQGAYLLI